MNERLRRTRAAMRRFDEAARRRRLTTGRPHRVGATSERDDPPPQERPVDPATIRWIA